MPGEEIAISTQRFGRLLERYLEVNTRNAGELVARKAGGVSVRLYRLTAACAPSKSEIVRDVKARGWQVKRPKGAWPLKKGEKRGSQGPLHRMQASQIGRRTKARGRVASGWSPATRRFGKNIGNRFEDFKRPKGTVIIEGAGSGSPRITISNQTPGIVKLQKKHNLVRTAFNQESADIVKYLRNKKSGLSGASVGGE